MTITIERDGTLKLPEEVLERLGTNQVNVRLDGKSVTLEPSVRKLYEIDDLDERMRAFDEWASRVVQKGSGSLPEDWATIRDGIYD